MNKTTTGESVEMYLGELQSIGQERFAPSEWEPVLNTHQIAGKLQVSANYLHSRLQKLIQKKLVRGGKFVEKATGKLRCVYCAKDVVNVMKKGLLLGHG